MFSPFRGGMVPACPVHQGDRDSSHSGRRQLSGDPLQLAPEPRPYRAHRILEERQFRLVDEVVQQLPWVRPVPVNRRPAHAGLSRHPLVRDRLGPFPLEQQASGTEYGLPAASGPRVVCRRLSTRVLRQLDSHLLPVPS